MIEKIKSFMDFNFPKIRYSIRDPLDKLKGKNVIIGIDKDGNTCEYEFYIDSEPTSGYLQALMDRAIYKFGKTFYPEVMSGFDLQAKRDFIKHFYK